MNLLRSALVNAAALAAAINRSDFGGCYEIAS